MTYNCTVCEATKTEPISKQRHKNADPVKENEIAATCTAIGSYDSVIYCRECGDELLRETITLKKLDHIPFNIIGTAPNCTSSGTTDSIICSECGTVIITPQAIPALGHTNPDSNGNCTRCGTHIKDVVDDSQIGNRCKYCGDIHNGFFGKIIGFFHSILALFGLRK